MAKKKNPLTAAVEIVKKQRKRNLPRTAFKTANEHSFRPGQSGNPGGKVKVGNDLLSKSLRVALADCAPDDVCKAVGLPLGHASWAQVLAHRLLYLAVRGDLQAMKEIREATEGQHSRVDLYGLDALDQNPAHTAPPLIELVFVESDGDGRVKKTIEGDTHGVTPTQ
jgi:hypothetical protein